MDKQRKIVLIYIIIGVIIFGLSIYFGMNYEMDRFHKKFNPNTLNDSTAMDKSYEIKMANEQMVFINKEYNYQITLPGYFSEPNTEDLSDISFLYNGIDDEEVVDGLILVRIYQQPYTTDLSLLENIKIFYQAMDNYEEINVNSQLGILASNNINNNNKAFFTIDTDKEVMFIIEGKYLPVAEDSQYTEVFESIINSLIIN